MMTSSATAEVLPTRSSSLALASGLSTALSKSKKASAAKVTFSLTGFGGAATGFGAGAGARVPGAAAGGGGATRGAGAAAGAAAGFSAPSQAALAVAGVQLASRQQSSLVPFFQTVPSVERQLSAPLDCAKAAKGAAIAADAKSTATLFSFFMILLSRKAADTCVMSKSEAIKAGKHPV